MEIDTHVIKELIAALDSSRVDSLVIETSEFKLKLEHTAGLPAACPPQPVYAPAGAPAKAAASTEASAQEALCGNLVTSPIVGTYYSSAAPDKAPFVTAGQKVKKGDTIYIVESMKLMNEIASEYDGTVAEIYLKNGQGVEFGQPVMRVE